MITDDRKRELVSAEVTLNGIRAKISGLQCAFPQIMQLEKPFQSFTYSWETTSYILEHHRGVFAAE